MVQPTTPTPKDPPFHVPLKPAVEGTGHHHQPVMERPMIIACAALILFALLATALTRLTGVGEPAAPDVSSVSASLTLQFRDEDGGGVGAYDAATGEAVKIWAPETGAFVRIALRSMTFCLLI